MFCFQNFQLQSKSAANRLPSSFPESLILFLLWLWVSLRSMWRYSDGWSRDKDPKYREPVSFLSHQNFELIMDAREEYAGQWAKKANKTDVDVDTLSEWVKSIADVLKQRIVSRFNFTYRFIDNVLSINNPEFESYLGQVYSVELEIKDPTERNISASYLDLLLWIGRDSQLHTPIYDKRNDVNFHITTFRFWVAIFQLRLPMASLSCSLYDIPGIASHMDVSFWKKNRDFQISAWTGIRQGTLEIVIEDTGILWNKYEVPLPRVLSDNLYPDHIQWQPSTDQTLYSPFVSYRTRFSQVFSYIIELRKKEKAAVKWCSFTIRNYIQT